MVDFDILNQMGSTKEALRALFTAPAGSDLEKKRKEIEDQIESRVQEGTLQGLRNYQFFAAGDLAWDSNLITKELVPLQMYAQGKITFAALKDSIKDLDPATQAKFCKRDDKGNITGLDIPAFHKVVVNLNRSFITRRTAALAERYTKLNPLFRYEPLSTSFVAKLRGDVISQRIEMISNSYGYRHEMIQSIREMLLYPYCVEFAATAWDIDSYIAKKKGAAGFDTSKDDKFETESRIKREGVYFTRPHPSRVSWDVAYPLSSINTDTGVTWMQYWSVCRYGDVHKNPAFFNRDSIAYSQAFMSELMAFKPYWELYFANSPINFPHSERGGSDVPGMNDREKNIGAYTADLADSSLLLNEYRWRVTPKDIGVGDYPYPVWVRLVIAGGRTVVFAEFLPSIPAVVWAYNNADNRLLNNAWSHDIMPWQDLMSNALTNTMLSQRSALVKLILMDLDLVNDPDVVQKIREIVSGEAIFNQPQLIEFKGSSLAEMGLKPREAISVSETQPINDITMYYKSLVQLLSLAERVLGMSANESAQSEAREISATESANIANTTNTTIAFMGIGVDEAVDAKKRLLYESMMACAESRIQVPAVNHYTADTVKAAGFKVLPEGSDGSPSETMYATPGSMIVGNKEDLVYDFNFSSRDGSERSSNAKAAQVLVQLVQQLSQIQGFIQILGKGRFYQMLNEIVVLSGAGVDLRFDLKDGESDQMPQPDPDGTTAGKAAIEQALHQMMDAIQIDRQQIAAIAQVIQKATGINVLQQAPGQTTQGSPPGAPAQGAPPSGPPAAPGGPAAAPMPAAA